MLLNTSTTQRLMTVSRLVENCNFSYESINMCEYVETSCLHSELFLSIAKLQYSNFSLYFN